jgi:di/tricarboxylate transporter
MATEIWIVFGILAATIALFISDKLRLDVTALLAMVALTLTGILTPAEAVAGFGDTTVILIAALFVVGEGLVQTGVAAALGRWLGLRAGTNELRILVLTMVVVAPLSAFISSTGTVAILLPVVVSLARRAGISPSKLLIPMAYAALIGGMLTLIGTPPNIVASEARVAAGREPFDFFAFTPIGLIVLAVSIGFLALFGRRLLPARAAVGDPGARSGPSLAELISAYGLPGTLVRLQVGSTSALAGRTPAESGLRRSYEATIVALKPGAGGAERLVTPATRLAVGDQLQIQVPEELRDRLSAELDLLPVGEAAPNGALAPGLFVVEVALTPRSAFIGRTIAERQIRTAYGVTVLGMQRLGRPFAGDLADEPLRFGDTLLVAGTAEAFAPLLSEQRFFGDFVVAAIPRELEEFAAARIAPQAPIAVAIVLAMLVFMATGWLPTVTAALVAALALLLSGCVGLATVYRRMSWESLVLIAAMLPMATALQKTGGAALIAEGLASSLGAYGPLALLVGIFLLTSVLSQFISNTATAVLMMPIAIAAANQVGVAPEPLLMTAAIAASTAFSTPIASPVNTLVLTPGDYRFVDYARAGVPLQVLVLVICVLVVPLLFPF